jgi:4-hydroxy-3-methylbut-2-enyl diphosphate reductase
MKTEIDKNSGFCFGVVNAIKKAEEELAKGGVLYCLGDIVHNSQEVARLEKMGLRTINHDELATLKDAKVLLRAHGEPPSTYQTARQNNITIIDASCPVVLKLQDKIKRAFQENADEQIVIYGKNGHAEVNGLVGQTAGAAIVVENLQDLEKIDFNRDICLFSQTTKSVDGFNKVVNTINGRIAPFTNFKYNDTICRQVANRIPDIRRFAQGHDVILFVSGKKSSNGRALFEECLKVNPHSYFISEKTEINPEWLLGANSIGICGATSTPKWLMEDIETGISSLCLT